MAVPFFVILGKFFELTYMTKNAPRGCALSAKEDGCLRNRASARESCFARFYFVGLGAGYIIL